MVISNSNLVDNGRMTRDVVLVYTRIVTEVALKGISRMATAMEQEFSIGKMVTVLKVRNFQFHKKFIEKK